MDSPLISKCDKNKAIICHTVSNVSLPPADSQVARSIPGSVEPAPLTFVSVAPLLALSIGGVRRVVAVSVIRSVNPEIRTGVTLTHALIWRT